MRFYFLLFLIGRACAYDIVIPVHHKDVPQLHFILDKVEERIKDYDRIFIVSKESYTDRAEWVDEGDYPFSIDDVGREIGGCGGVGKDPRRGWYYQQLLKLYVPAVIPDISEHYLILDADTIPNHEITFIDEEGRPILDCVNNQQSARSYYPHAKKMLPHGAVITRTENPVVHHMMFTRAILEDLFSIVEERLERPFWKAFLNMVINPRICTSRQYYTGASEYLTYFYFCMNYHRDEFSLRYVRTFERDKNFDRKLGAGIDFISCHNYNRTEVQ